jgi:hypothetical protein
MCYQQFASPAYCWVAGPFSKMTSQHEKAFCVLGFEVLRPRGPTVSTRSELLVAHKKLGQLSLLTVYVVPV